MQVDNDLRYDLIMDKPRNPIVVAMQKRYGKTKTTMRDRRDRRPKDARRSWRSESW